MSVILLYCIILVHFLLSWIVCECQTLMEVRLGKPVYAVDTAQSGRLLAVGGAGSKMLLSVLS